MATHTHLPTHGGLERVIERSETVKGVLFDTFSAKHLPKLVTGIAIMAVVTATERALDAVDTGFAYEWAILSVVALLSFVLLARSLHVATRVGQHWLAKRAALRRQRRADQKLWAFAKQDPRIMNELLVAEGRADDQLDETRPTLRADAQDDGLAAFAPWPDRVRRFFF